jgi:hypothetical protein
LALHAQDPNRALEITSESTPKPSTLGPPSEANEEPEEVLETGGEGFTAEDFACAGERFGVLAGLRLGDDPSERSIRRANDPPDAENRL